MAQRHRRRTLYGGQHDARVNVAHPWNFHQPLEDRVAERFEVRNSDVNKKIGRTSNREARDHLVKLGKLALEYGHDIVGVLLELDLNEGLHVQAQSRWIDDGRISFDD